MSLSSSHLMMSEDKELSQDALADILSHLPVKSLLRFRCVSKLWDSLIRSNTFTRLHLSRATSDTSRKQVLLCTKPFWSMKYDDVDEFAKKGSEGVITKRDAHPVIDGAAERSYCVENLEVCDGLMCVVVYKPAPALKPSTSGVQNRTICLWNPSTRECREMSKDDVANLVDEHSMFTKAEGFGKINLELYGFGYDARIDDYKVVRLFQYKDRGNLIDVEILRVGTMTWRKMEIQIPGIPHERTGELPNDCCFVNGACHWLMNKVSCEGSTFRLGVPSLTRRAILSFDLDKEKFGVVPLPDLSHSSVLSINLSTVNGQLLLVTHPAPTEVWVMNEYGVNGSWTKKVTLYQVPGFDHTEFLFPICFSRNGSILVLFEFNYLMVCDSKGKRYRGGHRHPLWHPLQPSLKMYDESLVSPHHVPCEEGNH